MQVKVDTTKAPYRYQVEGGLDEVSPVVAWLRQIHLPASFDLVWKRGSMTIKREFDSVEERFAYAASQEKIDLLETLRRQGIVYEECPVSCDWRTTAYWRFTVLKPDSLPASLKAEFDQLGELRW